VNDIWKKLATEYVIRAIIFGAGLVGVVFTTEQKETVSFVGMAIGTALVFLVGHFYNHYSNRKKTEVAVDARTLSAIGPTTPLVDAVLEAKDQQVLDPKRNNPPPLVQQAVGTTPDEIARAVENDPDLSKPVG
jgi:hypothetical protein